jgi:hypothetical protein
MALLAGSAAATTGLAGALRTALAAAFGADFQATSATWKSLDAMASGIVTHVQPELTGAGSMPVGTILHYDGAGIASADTRTEDVGYKAGDTVGQMPGWRVCNGQSGTPDLRGLFLRGGSTSGVASGSNDTPSHPHTNNLAVPDHSASTTGSEGTGATGSAGTGATGAATGTTDAEATHTHGQVAHAHQTDFGWDSTSIYGRCVNDANYIPLSGSIVQANRLINHGISATASGTGRFALTASDGATTTGKGDSHVHGLGSHTHTGPSHTHTGPAHTHTTPSLSHSALTGGVTSSGSVVGGNIPSSYAVILLKKVA